MLKKVNKLIGAELDYAVALVEGCVYGLPGTIHAFSPSTKWSQGGPIIAREKIHWGMSEQDGCMIYIASIFKQYNRPLTGPTELIAAMRCYVASKFGYMVEIPDEIGAK
jgi:hypothetical protein